MGLQVLGLIRDVFRGGGIRGSGLGVGDLGLLGMLGSRLRGWAVLTSTMLV